MPSRNEVEADPGTTVASQTGGSRVPELKDFRRRRQWDINTRNLLYTGLTVLVVLGFWEVATRFLEVPSYLVPPPAEVAQTLGESWRSLLEDARITAVEAALGFLAAVVIGTLLGSIIAFSAGLGRALYPVMIGVNSMPKIAVAPLFVVWLGFGIAPKIAITFLICFFPIVINTIVGLTSIPPGIIELARSMGGGGLRTFVKIRLPYALPAMFGGFKIAITLSIVGAIVGEFVAANSGLGYTITIATANFQTHRIFAALVVLFAVAVGLFGIVALAEKVVLGHRTSSAVARRG